MKQYETPVAEHLRSIRGADDVISRLRHQSIEGKAERIAEALASDPKFGHAKLNGVYGKINLVLASNEEGQTFQVKVNEDGDTIKLGRVTICETAIPVQDVAEEILKTASYAAEAILSENREKTPQLMSAIAKALDTKGDLRRRVELELDLQTIKGGRWYDSVVSEHYAGEEPDVPSVEIDESEDIDVVELMKTSISVLDNRMRSELALAGQAFAEAQTNGKVIDKTVLDAAQSVVEDMKRALDALNNVDLTNEQEMGKVFECVASQAPRLIKGARFVVQLVQSEQGE